MNSAHQNFETLPSRMQLLKRDARGWVVPWFVDYVNGVPDHRVMDGDKWRTAIRFKVCWTCGQPLGKYLTFVAGPMCGINRTSAEPPSHIDCARWSAMNCPFLSDPEMVRRVDATCPADGHNQAGIALMRNPGVTMLWTTNTFTALPDFTKKSRLGLLTFGDPTSVEFLKCGRTATRAEVEASIESGLPALMAVAMQQEGGIKHLVEARSRFEKHLPEASRDGLADA